eukprot:gene13962-biopygen5070
MDGVFRWERKRNSSGHQNTQQEYWCPPPSPNVVYHQSLEGIDQVTGATRAGWIHHEVQRSWPRPAGLHSYSLCWRREGTHSAGVGDGDAASRQRAKGLGGDWKSGLESGFAHGQKCAPSLAPLGRAKAKYHRLLSTP